MEETSEKVPFEAYSSLKPRGFVRMKTTAVVAFIAGAILLLFGGIGAFCLWKVSEKEVMQLFSNLLQKNITFGSIYQIQPTKEAEKSDVGTLVWIASEEPLKDVSFLSSEILRFCGDLPIYWHHPANSRASRKRRSVARVRRQNTGGLNRQQARRRNSTSSAREDEQPTGPDYNPENPYHRNEEGSEGHMVFDPMLDHLGICCTECHRSYTHCERVCEPHGGYQAWPYNYHGCRQVCRVIMPCRWWAARVLGLV
uniref:Leukocyte cell-derived chemotaxin 1 n=1 Tax=Cyprinus carpio TaxID=7962 RepID=A0A8C2E992_CYPCA